MMLGLASNEGLGHAVEQALYSLIATADDESDDGNRDRAKLLHACAATLGAELQRLRAMDTTWRNAQKACEHCAPLPRWWHCDTHGNAMPKNAWGCPECVRELRLQVRQADERGDAAMRRAHAAEAQLEIAARGLKHCAGWNISEDTRNALMAVVMESEALLVAGPNVRAKPGPTAAPTLDEDEARGAVGPRA